MMIEIKVLKEIYTIGLFPSKVIESLRVVLVGSAMLKRFSHVHDPYRES